MYAGICPSCQKSVNVKYKGMSASQKGGTGHLAIAVYLCSSCDTILGVQADPLLLMSDQTNRIKKLLGR